MTQNLTQRKDLRGKRAVQVAAFLTLLFLWSAPVVRAADEATMLVKGKTSFQLGEYYVATTWLERMLTKYPDTPHRSEVLLLLTKACARSDRNEKSVYYLRMLRKEFPQTAETFDAEYRKPAAPVTAPGTRIDPSPAAALLVPTAALSPGYDASRIDVREERAGHGAPRNKQDLP